MKLPQRKDYSVLSKIQSGHKNYFREVIKITEKTFKLLRARRKSTINSDTSNYNQSKWAA